VATRLPNASQQAGADAVVDRIDLGSGTATGKLRVYSGAQPADADSAPVGTLLLEVDLANPAYGAANTSGTAALASTPRTGTGAAAGTAQSFRVINRDGATVFDGAVTATGGGGQIELDNTNIAVGQTVNITSLSYTHPAG
jgi:hypothetical protein